MIYILYRSSGYDAKIARTCMCHNEILLTIIHACNSSQGGRWRGGGCEGDGGIILLKRGGRGSCPMCGTIQYTQVQNALCLFFLVWLYLL